MQTQKLAFGMVVAIACLAGAIWATRFAPWVDRAVAAPNAVLTRLQEMKAGAARRSGEKLDDGDKPLDPNVEARPPIVTEGPLPQAVVGEQFYQFGRMDIGEKKTHRFKIENKGQSPLRIAKGPTECKCTISNLATREVHPGGFAEVEVFWSPLEPDPAFEKSAINWTNDPQRPEIQFRIAGKVARTLVVLPTSWRAGIVAEDRDGKATGKVVTDVDAGFKILSAESTDPNVKVSYRPMSASAIERVGMLAGYEFTASVGKGIPIGTYRTRLKILTSLEPKTPLEVELTAVRPGPIRYLTVIPIVGSARWNTEKALLNLGRFRHEVGSKIVLPALISETKGDFRAVGIKSTDSFLKVSIEPNPTGEKSEPQGVRFVFEVPPGSPPVNYFDHKTAHVTVETNHPTLKHLDFDLEFVSL